MQTIRIIGVGKVKERYYAQACAEYEKRLSRYVKLECIEVADERAPERMSEKQALQVKQTEGARILAQIKDEFVIALAIKGKRFTSEQFAQQFADFAVQGKSTITLVIGGSIGLSDAVLARADAHLSFSDFTFCHQLMRVILLEQLYRSQKILAKERYHK